MNIERVQVATKILNEPIPGVLVNTEMGDVIYILDRTTGITGIHAPSKMKMYQISSYMDQVCTEFTAQGVDPFRADDTFPLIFEESFIFHKMDA